MGPLNESSLGSLNSTSTNPDAYCFKLRLVGVYCLLLFLLAFSYNVALLYVFYKFKKLLVPVNMFVVALTVCNLFGVVLELPMVIMSSFKCMYVYSLH